MKVTRGTTTLCKLLALEILVSLGMGTISLALPLYGKELGANYTEIGLLGFVYFVPHALLLIPMGSISDRYGRKPPLILGLAGTTLVYVWFSYASSVPQLLLIGLIDGIFEVPLWLCIQASIADLSKERTMGGAMGLYSTAWGIGFALGPFFGGYLYGMIGAKTFIVGGLFVLFAALIAVCTKLPHPKLFETKMHENKFFKNLKNMKFFLPICLSGFIVIGTASVVLKLFPVYARYLGFTPFQIGFLMGISMLVRTILFIPMGNLGDRAGYDRMISAGLLGLALTFAGMVVAKNLLQWGAVLILMGISGSILMPALLSKASLVGKTRGLGYTLGIYNFFTVMGWGVMPTVGGIVADIFGPTTPYLFCTLILLLAIGIIKIKKSK